MSDIIGVRNNNTIVPYTAATKKTKWLSFNQSSGAYSITGDNSWSTVNARVQFYADSAGVWWMRLRASGTTGSATTITLAINSVTFSATANYYQGGGLMGVGTSPYSGTYRADPDTSTIILYGSASTAWRFEGDFELKSEPTAYTTAANMEGVLPVDVYIPPASTTPGLLSYYEEYTSASAACTGALTTSVSWKIVRIGKLVTLTLPQTLGAGVATSSFVYGVAVPARFLPAQNTAAIVELKNNAARQSTPGMVIVETNGAISVYNSLTGGTNFTVTAECGLIEAHSISWVQ